MACLILCFKVPLKAFERSNLSVGIDGLGGLDGYLNATADNNHASLKGGYLGPLELVDLRNPTQNMQRFQYQWRQ